MFKDYPKIDYTESRWSLIKIILYSYLFKKITSKTLNLFLRAGDIISVHPQINGSHEPKLNSLIAAIAKEGFCDFIIDVGANIGLTSCQNGHLFKKIHMFEPNPLCYKILEVNSMISLDNNLYTIHKFGIGREDKFTTLTVPKKNWGGGFVKSENSYDLQTLVEKDGFNFFDKNNYLEVDIELRRSTDVFAQVFCDLQNMNLKNGVIKIDVEGYEPLVIKGIAETLPPNMNLYILFESWNPHVDFKGLCEPFGKRANIGVLESRKIRKWLPFKLIDTLALIFSRKQKAHVQPIDNTYRMYEGDIVIRVV
jgi:FkbM family methyltransferase